MQQFYYELVIQIESSCKDFILDLILELYDGAIEEEDKKIVICSENGPLELLELKDRLLLLINKQTELKDKIKIDFFKKENKDWIESYKKSIEPIAIGSFFIRPPWHKKRDGYIDIIIEPALAFGSGHHESTSLCIEILQEITKKDNTLLDVGSGSGILGICASKMGAKVDFCDTDVMAIESSIKNFKLNSVAFCDYWIGSCHQSNKKYDIVVANIVADILIAISKDLKTKLKDSAYLLLSGIINEHKEKLIAAYSDLKIVKEVQKNEWTTILFENR